MKWNYSSKKVNNFEVVRLQPLFITIFQNGDKTKKVSNCNENSKRLARISHATAQIIYTRKLNKSDQMITSNFWFSVYRPQIPLFFLSTPRTRTRGTRRSIFATVDNHYCFKFLSVRRRAGSPWFADFLPWKWPESVFLVLINLVNLKNYFKKTK